jgi:hypothetical protein
VAVIVTKVLAVRIMDVVLQLAGLPGRIGIPVIGGVVGIVSVIQVDPHVEGRVVQAGPLVHLAGGASPTLKIWKPKIIKFGYFLEYSH